MITAAKRGVKNVENFYLNAASLHRKTHEYMHSIKQALSKG